MKRNLGEKVMTKLKFISKLEPDTGHQDFQIGSSGNCIETTVYGMYSPLLASVVCVGYQQSCNVGSVCFN